MRLSARKAADFDLIARSVVLTYLAGCSSSWKVNVAIAQEKASEERSSFEKPRLIGATTQAATTA